MMSSNMTFTLALVSYFMYCTVRKKISTKQHMLHSNIQIILIAETAGVFQVLATMISLENNGQRQYKSGHRKATATNLHE